MMNALLSAGSLNLAAGGDATLQLSFQVVDTLPTEDHINKLRENKDADKLADIAIDLLHKVRKMKEVYTLTHSNTFIDNFSIIG
jgi:hypothetical protein